MPGVAAPQGRDARIMRATPLTTFVMVRAMSPRIARFIFQTRVYHVFVRPDQC